MMYRDRRTLLLIVPVLAFLMVATGLYLSSDYLSRVVLPKLHIPLVESSHELPTPDISSHELLAAAPTPDLAGASEPAPEPTPVLEPTPTSEVQAPIEPAPKISVKNGTILEASRIQYVIDAILDPESPTSKRMPCPPINETRYGPLKDLVIRDSEETQIQFFFALNLRKNLNLLSRLLGSVVEVITFLGPERCALSIVEGNSPDGTGEVLEALTPFLDQLDIQYFYSSSDINPSKGNRIEKLAKLRNMALQPLIDSFENGASEDITVLFLNDVAACSEDILELALQRQRLGADMTCAMDWTTVGESPTFYDVWISRDIKGNSFFEIPENGSWENAWNLFWDDPYSKQRLNMHQPFQVFACWNGAVVFRAAPLKEGIRFRDSSKGHCKHGEPQNFCKDLWAAGHGKIAVVPTVNLEYSNTGGLTLKKYKGYVTDLVRSENQTQNMIDWSGPPEQVRCIENWGNQFWKPWQLSRRALLDPGT